MYYVYKLLGKRAEKEALVNKAQSLVASLVESEERKALIKRGKQSSVARCPVIVRQTRLSSSPLGARSSVQAH